MPPKVFEEVASPTLNRRHDNHVIESRRRTEEWDEYQHQELACELYAQRWSALNELEYCSLWKYSRHIWTVCAMLLVMKARAILTTIDTATCRNHSSRAERATFREESDV